MKIFLLTHERELHRATNTGAIAIDDSNGIVERILWQRVNPDKNLTRLIENNEAVLLYSSAESSHNVSTETETETETAPVLAPANIEEYEHIIIIDSTWQEARKIYKQSPYLKNAAQFTLKTINDSSYKLRANQPKGGLCTIECIIEVLRVKGHHQLASEFSIKFDRFNS